MIERALDITGQPLNGDDRVPILLNAVAEELAIVCEYVREEVL